jgi:hypothetical protein
VVKLTLVEGKVASMVGMSPLKEQPSQFRQELADIAISISNFEGSIYLARRFCSKVALS